VGISVEWDQVFKDGLTDTVTYTATGQAGVEISAILTREAATTEYLDDGKWRMRRRGAICQAEDVPTPSSRDTVTISGETWQVEDEDQVQRSDAGMVTLPMVIKTRDEVSGPDHRLRR